MILSNDVIIELAGKYFLRFFICILFIPIYIWILYLIFLLFPRLFFSPPSSFFFFPPFFSPFLSVYSDLSFVHVTPITWPCICLFTYCFCWLLVCLFAFLFFFWTLRTWFFFFCLYGFLSAFLAKTLIQLCRTYDADTQIHTARSLELLVHNRSSFSAILSFLSALWLLFLSFLRMEWEFFQTSCLSIHAAGSDHATFWSRHYLTLFSLSIFVFGLPPLLSSPSPLSLLFLCLLSFKHCPWNCFVWRIFRKFTPRKRIYFVDIPSAFEFSSSSRCCMSRSV